MGFYDKIYSHSPLLVQNAMISLYGYHWMKRRMGGSFSELYKAAKERESFTESQWNDLENAALQKMLVHAFENVPYYKKTFSEVGSTIDDIKKITVDTIHKLPVLTKEQLRQFGTTSLLSMKKEPHGEFFASSGSTGTPTQILFSHAMHQRWFAIFEARVRNWAGVTSHTPRGMIGGRRVLPSSKNNAPFYRYNSFEKQVYFSAYHISKKNAANYLHGMEKYDVQYMTGYAMSNFFLARSFKELDVDAPFLQAVITSSEKLTDEMRDMFNEVYHCKTYDGWSGVEACALITECEHGSLHISPDAGLIEVLDENMQPVPFGKQGRVYCTGYLNFDQPLIRYEIGDEIILLEKNVPVEGTCPLCRKFLAAWKMS